MRCLLLPVLLIAASVVSAQDATTQDSTPATTGSMAKDSDFLDLGDLGLTDPSEPASTPTVISAEPHSSGNATTTANTTEPSGNTTSTTAAPSSAVTVSCFSAVSLCILGALVVS